MKKSRQQTANTYSGRYTHLGMNHYQILAICLIKCFFILFRIHISTSCVSVCVHGTDEIFLAVKLTGNAKADITLHITPAI